jgi:hypothetical protein
MNMTHPVIETNIERILEDHIFTEIDGLMEKIKEYQAQISALEARKERLVRIAKAAELIPLNTNQDDHENSHYFR